MMGVSVVVNLILYITSSNERCKQRAIINLLIEPSVLGRIHFVELMKNRPHSFVCEIVNNLLQN